MNFEVGEFHYFKPYYFTDKLLDNKDLKGRNCIVCLSKEALGSVSQSSFGSSLSEQALFCSIVSIAKEKYVHILKKSDYSFLNHDSYACATRVDMQNTNESKQFNGILKKNDAKHFYKILRNSLYCPYTINDICKKKFIKAAIIQEWKYFLSLI